jgi:hypothetical protein
LYNYNTEQTPAPISETEFFKTVAELEKDYNRRSAPPKQPAVNDRPPRKPLGETHTSGNILPRDIPSDTDGDEPAPSSRD